jgi:nucleoside-diphosphate-sugar epimerase
MSGMECQSAEIGPIAVTGASGWVGSEVCAWLDAHAYEVRRLSRSPVASDHRCFNLEGGGNDREAREALDGCMTVIHCAAHVHRRTETNHEQEQFRRVNVEGTARLLAASRAVGVRRFVFASTLAVYDWAGPHGPRDEEAGLRPLTAYARSKREGERLVQEAGLDWRIARLATVYGRGDRANFSRLAAALRRGRFVIPGDGAARKSVLPVARAGELLARWAVDPGHANQVMNLAAPTAPSLAEICTAFSEACGFGPARHLPLAPCRVLARLADWIAVVYPRLPRATDILSKLTTDTVVDVARMQQTFPLLPWGSFASTLQPAASYYRSC